MARKEYFRENAHHTSIQIGDVVNIVRVVGDVRLTVSGIVGKRERFVSRTTEYLSPDGYVLLVVHADGTTSPESARINIVARTRATEEVTLFDV